MDHDMENEGFSPGNTNRMDLYSHEVGEKELEMDPGVQHEAMQLNLDAIQADNDQFDEMEQTSIEPGMVAEEPMGMHSNSDQSQPRHATNGHQSVIFEESSQEDREMDGNSSAKLLPEQSRLSAAGSSQNLSIHLQTQSMENQPRNQPDLSPKKSARSKESKESTRLQDATGNAVPGGTFIL